MIEKMKALGDENRLRILNILNGGQLCVCELEVLLMMTQSNVSRHLMKLKTCGIISASKDAQWVHYQIDKKFMEENQNLYQHLCDHFLKLDRYVDDYKRLENYQKNHLNCQYIAQDRDQVMKIIQSGGSWNETS